MNEKEIKTFKVDDYDALDKICDMICEKDIQSLKELRYYIQEDLKKHEFKECKGLNRFFEAHAELLALYLDGSFKPDLGMSFDFDYIDL